MITLRSDAVVPFDDLYLVEPASEPLVLPSEDFCLTMVRWVPEPDWLTTIYDIVHAPKVTP